MDAAYTRHQAETWHNMSEAAQHAWMRREIPGHVDTCELCHRHGFLPNRRK